MLPISCNNRFWNIRVFQSSLMHFVSSKINYFFEEKFCKTGESIIVLFRFVLGTVRKIYLDQITSTIFAHSVYTNPTQLKSWQMMELIYIKTLLRLCSKSNPLWAVFFFCVVLEADLWADEIIFHWTGLLSKVQRWNSVALTFSDVSSANRCTLEKLTRAFVQSP